MTTTTDSPSGTDLRDRPAKFLRASLGAMASRGETTGPRVAATRAALTWQRQRATLINDIGLTEAAADDLLDAMAATDADANGEVPA